MKRKAEQQDDAPEAEEGVFHVTHACNPSGLKRVYDSLHSQLTAEHSSLLDRWPFRHFLNLPQIGMSRQFITDMLRRWVKIVALSIRISYSRLMAMISVKLTARIPRDEL